tara:strand:- start:375 stop:581 length:207 start_codon:yes stop_codon:yes gene_type:complete
MIKKIKYREPKEKLEIPKVIREDISYYLMTGWVHRYSQDRALELLNSRRYYTRIYEYENRGTNTESWE